MKTSPQTKICTSYKTIKAIIEYSKHSGRKDGRQNTCRKCDNSKSKEYQKTVNGMISAIYGAQKTRSKKRGHPQPAYTKEELTKWLLNQKLFHELYKLWVESNYKKYQKPSIDRINNNEGYFFDNIQLMTWGENCNKSYEDHKKCKFVTGIAHKAVKQFTKDKKFIKEFISIGEAFRQTGVNHISKCCNRKRKYAGGYMWEHS